MYQGLIRKALFLSELFKTLLIYRSIETSDMGNPFYNLLSLIVSISSNSMKPC